MLQLLGTMLSKFFKLVKTGKKLMKHYTRGLSKSFVHNFSRNSKIDLFFYVYPPDLQKNLGVAIFWAIVKRFSMFSKMTRYCCRLKLIFQLLYSHYDMIEIWSSLLRQPNKSNCHELFLQRRSRMTRIGFSTETVSLACAINTALLTSWKRCRHF